MLFPESCVCCQVLGLIEVFAHVSYIVPSFFFGCLTCPEEKMWSGTVAPVLGALNHPHCRMCPFSRKGSFDMAL